jgi:hypothetical protein
MTHVLRTFLLALAVAAAYALSVTPAAPAATTFSIRTSDGFVARIGGFHPRRSATLASAISTFGTPSSRRFRGDSGCEVRWRSLHLRMTFYNLGAAPIGTTTCTPSVGLANDFTVRGPRFRTSAGLRVGDASSRITELYADAELHDGAWWLVSAYSNIGEGGDYPVLRAIVAAGRVRAIAGVIGGAGE